MNVTSFFSETATASHQPTEGSSLTAQEEPSGDPKTTLPGNYLSRAMEQYENEHVSFTSFVHKFRLSDLQDAQDTYKALIDSTQLKTLRRQSLNTTYNSFVKHGLRRFWPNYLLRIERRETKTNFDITAAKTARILQDASLKETLRAAGLLENDSQGQDKLELSVRPKRKMH